MAMKNMTNKLIKNIVIMFAIFFCLIIATGCGKEIKEINSVNDLLGPDITIAYPLGAGAMFEAEKVFKNAKLVSLGDDENSILSLRKGMVDAYCQSREYLEYYCMTCNITDCKILKESFGESANIAFGISRKSNINNLKEKANEFVALCHKNGVVEKLLKKWTSDKNASLEKVELPSDSPVTLKVATFGKLQPFSFFKGNELVGFDIDIANLFAKHIGAKIEFHCLDFTAMIMAAGTGKVDIVSSDLNITEERAKEIDFSDILFSSENALIVRGYDSKNDKNQVSFWEDLKASFNRTFIVEDRWKLITDGLGVTILISVCSGILGSIIGFCLCMLRRTKNKVIDNLTLAFIRIIQGIPAVVFLMVLYYVVFGKVDISPVTVSIIGFAINFGAYVSEMMRTGIEAVDIGQNEAAIALGYSNSQSFFKVVFPQAAKHFLPVMKGEFISMVKMTSIVGYIAGQDLTKATDIIRARTMEAFFPLIVTAVIYFVIANLMTYTLSIIETKVVCRKQN